ncbi:hypothetical protein [Paenibacillus contaminans]|uniref:BtrH N-terminal domain-containing protein n=1 Tax=Paenibacillus contaminans TaxID=450362 RepID=A0A329MWK9_9BACL|nr:hypothetical protein [Paenibacillus contaminans]RAV22873.1 hypothetical protein DQG23_01300 [Paenibacillus contaminans]
MKGQKVKVINGLRYDGGRSNLSNINAYSACLKQLDSPYPLSPWLYGAIGVPFLFRVGGEVNTAPVLHELPHDRIAGLLGNIGVQVAGISAIAEGDSLNALRRKAWDAVRHAIDAGYPCFGRGFAFNYGETSVVQGYDLTDEAYICSCWDGTRAEPWQTLGERDGLVDVYWMMKNDYAEDDCRTVKEALHLAVEFAEGKLTGSRTLAGSRAYEHWVAELRRGAVDGWYFAYNTHEWDTCRTYGHKFLLEAKRRLGEHAPEALDEAIGCFDRVREAFHQVYELFPWEQPRGLIEDAERRLEAAKLLEQAKTYDAKAIETFRRVVNAL